MPEDREETPWLFRLDELDLLGLNFHETREHARASFPTSQVIEQEIVEEQEETEARAERELDAALGPFSEPCPHHDHPEDVDRSMEELLHSPVASDPLASVAYRWAQSIHRGVPAISLDAEHYRHVFRIHLNAPVVPAKLAFAGEEERTGTADGLLVAEKETELAVIYLGRILDSIDVLAKQEGVDQAAAALFLRVGADLLVQARTKQQRLARLRRSRFGGPHFES